MTLVESRKLSATYFFIEFLVLKSAVERKKTDSGNTLNTQVKLVCCTGSSLWWVGIDLY